jgi:hypothetical protein
VLPENRLGRSQEWGTPRRYTLHNARSGNVKTFNVTVNFNFPSTHFPVATLHWDTVCVGAGSSHPHLGYSTSYTVSPCIISLNAGDVYINLPTCTGM